MPLAKQNMLDEVMSLPPLERAGLIERLLSSFGRHSRDLIDSAWATEAEKRIANFEAGNSSVLSLEESRKRINLHRHPQHWQNRIAE